MSEIIKPGIDVSQTPKEEHGKRRELLDSLRGKVTFVTEFLRTIESVDESSDVEAQLDTAFKVLANKIFDEQAEKELDQLTELEDQKNEYYRILNEQEVDLDEMSDEQQKMFDAAGDLDDAARELGEEKPYLSFLKKLQDLKSQLFEKRDDLLSFPEDDEQLPDALVRFLPGVTYEDFDHVIRQPFSINIVLKPEAYDRFLNTDEAKIRSAGVHFKGTPVNVIRAGRSQEEIRLTIQHENIHNVTDDVVITEDPARVLDGRVQMARRMLQYHNVGYEVALKNMKSAARYVNALHGELIAAFEQEEATGFMGVAPGKSHNYSGYHIAFSTAGRYVTLFLQEELPKYIKEAKEAGEQELVEAFHFIRDDVQHRFKRIVSQMNEYAVMSLAIGQEARDQTELLFAILRPTQYHHVKTFLEEFYGKETVARAYDATKLRFFYSIDSLRRGVDAVKASPEMLTDEIKNAILLQVENLDGSLLGESDDLGLTSLEALREYREMLGVLNEMINGGEENDRFHLFDYHVVSTFFDRFLEVSEDDNWDELASVHAQCSDEEREHLIGQLEMYMENFMEEDMYEQGLIDDDSDVFAEFSKLSLWGAIQKMGMAETAERIFKKK